MDSLGLPGWITGYNGKPALLTKSGAIFRGDDYIEISFNTMRFGARARPSRLRGNGTALAELGPIPFTARGCLPSLTHAPRLALGSCAGFLTKKGIHHLFPRFAEYDFHAALTIEGRSDAELPEQTLLATRLRGLDLEKLASEVDIEAEPVAAT